MKLCATLLLAACAALPAAAHAALPRYDTAIVHARVLDVRTGRVREHTTVLLQGGCIAAVEPDAAVAPAVTNVIDAAGRLVTPGIVDVHFHAGEIVNDSLALASDSLAATRRRLADAYLPFGVTTVRSCGDDERWLPMLRAWMVRDVGAPDFYACGGALVSPNDRHFAGHVVVDGPEAARAKVRQYHDAGLKHLKVYWRLRDPEFAAAMDEAKRLGMNVCGHIDYKVLGVHRALELGLRQFEHVYTLGVDAIDSTGYAYASGDVFVDHYADCIRDGRVAGSFFVSRAEMFRSLGMHNPALAAEVADLRAHGAGVTPTLHVFAQRFGLTWFTTPSKTPGYDDAEALPDSALARCREGYRVMSETVKQLFDAGVPLTVGSDWADPGKACLSEMLLLHECGIPMTDVFAAATCNGAREVGLANETGAIEPGLRANLVIFAADPLADPPALLGARVVIKDGALVR